MTIYSIQATISSEHAGVRLAQARPNHARQAVEYTGWPLPVFSSFPLGQSTASGKVGCTRMVHVCIQAGMGEWEPAHCWSAYNYWYRWSHEFKCDLGTIVQTMARVIGITCGIHAIAVIMQAPSESTSYHFLSVRDTDPVCAEAENFRMEAWSWTASYNTSNAQWSAALSSILCVTLSSILCVSVTSLLPQVFLLLAAFLLLRHRRVQANSSSIHSAALFNHARAEQTPTTITLACIWLETTIILIPKSTIWK